ncbi:MAG: S8 family serine peptidase [Bryobacteraceae bacterium]|nr:S8 family serine peptidase [Bryobacteraceae bacterium]
MKFLFQALVLLLVSNGAALAADLLIVRAPSSYMQELSAKFRFNIQKRILGQDIYLVQSPAGITGAQLMRDLENYDYGKDPDTDDDDDDDVRAEDNFSVTLAETGDGLPRLVTNTTPVVNAITNRTFVSFHGKQAWTGYVNQPSASRIRISETHRRYGTAGAIVAIIDTGIDPNHPLLADSIVSGYDFIRDLPGVPSELDDLDPLTRELLNPYTTAILDVLSEVNPYTTAILDQFTARRLDAARLPPQFGHGTMVAGIIRLVAPSARIMPLKPFGGDGRARLFHLLQAMYFAVDHGASVVNMSLSLAAPSEELERAVEYAASKGVVLVASVGNSGRETMSWPAGYQQVIGVAATSMQDTPAVFTNFGDNVTTIGAPGEAVITLYPGGRYAAGWGTSFSAPMVSGAVSIMKRLKPSINWEKAEAAVKEAAPATGGMGNGRLDMFRAVRKSTEF